MPGVIETGSERKRSAVGSGFQPAAGLLPGAPQRAIESVFNRADSTSTTHGKAPDSPVTHCAGN